MKKILIIAVTVLAVCSAYFSCLSRRTICNG